MPGGGKFAPQLFFENSYSQTCLTDLFLFMWTFNTVVDVMISQKKFPRSYMDFEEKYQKDPGMNRVNLTSEDVFLHQTAETWEN